MKRGATKKPTLVYKHPPPLFVGRFIKFQNIKKFMAAHLPLQPHQQPPASTLPHHLAQILRRP